MVSLTVHRLREWPRLLAGGIVVAIVLIGVGLLIGTTIGSTSTTEVRTQTVTSTVTVQSPAQAARLRADGVAIATLNRQLRTTHRRLNGADRALRTTRRGRHGAGARKK